MFERFTDRARRVLVLAQQEAYQLDHNFIGTEHLLLGLCHEGEGAAATALARMGVRLEAARQKVEQTIGPAGSTPTGPPPFTPRAKKVLELSLRESLQLGQNYIGTEHILLGLLREGEGVAVQVLIGLSVDLSELRQVVISTIGEETPLAPAVGTGPGTQPSGGPRCPYCNRRLDTGGVAYKVLKVPRAERDEPADVADIAFVYCTSCGKVIADAPFSDIGESDA